MPRSRKRPPPKVNPLVTFRTQPLMFQQALVVPSCHGPKRFGDIMADFQRERFEQINPALLSVARGERPATGRWWWEATKGASKDSDLAVCLLWLLAFTDRPLTCQVGAADADQADEMRKAAKDILHLNPWLEERVEVLSWKVVCRATSSECEIVAADVSGSHGARPDVLILNELSHVTKQEFAENLMDNAEKVPHGLAVIATNSGFTGTWQRRWREIAETSDRWKMNVYSRPSPWLDEAAIAEAKRRNSRARFMRLWHGVWSSQFGDALDAADIEAAINRNLKPLKWSEPRWEYVGGLDLGVKQDHSALVVIGYDRETLQLRLVHALNWAPSEITGKVDLMAVERAVLDAHRRFSLKACGYDPHQAQLMAQRLELQRVPMYEMTFTGANLNLMASTLLDVFRSRRVELYDVPQLIDDLGRLTIEEKSYGYRLSAIRNESGHADLAVALSIALPIAVDENGRVPVRVGAIDLDSSEDFSLTPLQRYLRQFESERDESDDEMKLLSGPDPFENPWREAMRLVGRR
jgi:phage terminase large subunit-like protein